MSSLSGPTASRIPSNVWKGEDAYIIGGGPSLLQLPLSRLEGRNVIGCNDAYRLGKHLLSCLFFGDKKWWNYHQDNVEKLSIPVYTVAEVDDPCVISLPRSTSGFQKDSLGWNGNTGVCAINLALLMGVKRIFLLGFDMVKGSIKVHQENTPFVTSLKALLPKERVCSNWHHNALDDVQDFLYERYRDALEVCMTTFYQDWPGVELVNLSPGTAITCIPRRDWREILGEV